MKKLMIIGFLSLSILGVASCKNATIENNYPENPQNIRNERAGKFFDEITFFDKKKNNSKKTAQLQKPITQNIVAQKKSSKLWLASIEVIGSLLPLSTVDESSGLIITEWYQDGKNQNDRIKINLLVRNSKPIKENLILTIFKQTKINEGTWVDQQANNQNLTALMIKDKIIQKAQTK
ncbi:MAG: hypothetical protein ACJAZX_000646 [Rickettsiales bacterium]|jgi:hypothetical protein